MPRRKKTSDFDFVNSSPKKMRRKKPINTEQLTDIQPLTDNQKLVFDAYENNKNLFLYGCAGTGKTFIAMYLALKEILSNKTAYEKLYVVRSLVPTREIGFLPGDHEDKAHLYQIPYQNMVKYMFKMPDDPAFEMLYDNLKAQDLVKTNEKNGILDFMKILEIMDEFANIEFDVNDIVRSGLIRNYIITKLQIGL